MLLHMEHMEVIQTQASLCGESRDRYKETGRGKNQASSPNKHQIQAGIRQTGNREQADKQGTETLEYRELEQG